MAYTPLKSAIAALPLAFALVHSHSTWVRIALNGEWQDPLRYIRNKTAPYDDAAITVDFPWTLRLYNDPTWPIDRPESVRCGRDHMNHASSTDVLKVRAGDTVTFAHQLWDPFEWKSSQFFNCTQGRGTCDDQGYTMGLYHDGPVVAHLSKVPEGQDIRNYDGSGDWVKIYTLGVRCRQQKGCGGVRSSVGAALIAIFGAIPSPAHSLPELLELLGRWQFIAWMSLQAVVVLAMALSIELVGHFNSIAQNPKFRLARGLAYGCISGILSAHSLLFAKSAVELILRTIADGDNQFMHWQSWVLVLGLVALALSQLYYLHRGLKLVSTSVLYPLVFCIYNIIAILDGLIYFRQTDLISPLHGGLIALGTAILLSGVLALSWRLSDEQHPPVVGQSSLAPGLGLVEDTEGEEESVVDSDFISEDEGILPTYDTLAPSRETASLIPNRKPSRRWNEEIWGELEDQQYSRPSRQRSSTMPTGPALNESTPLLPGRKLTGGSSMSVSSPADHRSGESPRRINRRRRKSMGFPGFTARKHDRRKSSSTAGVQDALGGILKLRWWRRSLGNNSNNNSHTDIAVASPTGSSSGQPWILGGPRRQRRHQGEQQMSPRASSYPPPGRGDASDAV
ncbi:hypothetical protein NUW58_g2887 [Xylaria curta]|uniref:Uncharacterized protein n=1 Tax=Xylaria curta TaxID=42375 RepID=A0ACC1PF41_9PEZI|nr:hypothetical protein NUW58_g2887 [Xylaria curta]